MAKENDGEALQSLNRAFTYYDLFVVASEVALRIALQSLNRAFTYYDVIDLDNAIAGEKLQSLNRAFTYYDYVSYFTRSRMKSRCNPSIGLSPIMTEIKARCVFGDIWRCNPSIGLSPIMTSGPLRHSGFERLVAIPQSGFHLL